MVYLNHQPIGIFDSGVGGLTVLQELTKQMPHETIVYFGDTGRVPYGNRSNEIILQYAKQDMAFLLSKQVKLIVAACGTASSILNKEHTQLLPVPYTGVIFHTAKKACASTKQNKIGIIGTTATIKSKSYEKTIHAMNPNILTYAIDCPLFVPLVENGMFDPKNQITALAVKHYLTPLKQMGIDTLILGCTHYPLLMQNIADFMGNDVSLINPGLETACYIKDFINTNNLQNTANTPGNIYYFVSDNTEQFKQNKNLFIGYQPNITIEKINIGDF